ncbi:MAG: Fic family protein, partial [Acetoanaerobium sp.]|nr:Fic family protein [Acetoanaerobium sp.]
WEDWIIYILKGIQNTSERSLRILKELNKLIEETSIEIKEKLPKIHSKELVNLIFTEFYTRISSVENELNVTRKTASNYLNELAETNILTVEVRGKDKIFINRRLIELMKRL